MRTVKTYIFKQRRWWITDLIMLSLIIVMLLCLIISARHAPLAILLICPVPVYLIYLQQYTIRVIRQYNKADNGKTIIISEDRNELTFIQNDKQFIIQHEAVKNVLLFEQASLGKFGKYSYLIICTEDKNFLITNFTIPSQGWDPILMRFLSKKPRQTFTTKFNFIKPEYL